VTDDSWTIHGDYYPAQQGRKTVLLIHGAGERRGMWRGLETMLRREGFGALAIDLRGYGESSVGPDGSTITFQQFRSSRNHNDYAEMRRDVEAAAAYLRARGVRDEDMGLVGAYVGGTLALKYAVLHSSVAFVAMIEPGMSYENVPTVNALRAYRDRPILLLYSDRDKTSSRAVPLLYEFAKRSAGPEKAALLNIGSKRLTGAWSMRHLFAWIEDPAKARQEFTVAASSAVPAAPAVPMSSIVPTLPRTNP
jgi:alpha-beta hydrolase superfamily lysophospholipase